MQRIRQRKFGKDGDSLHASGASHVIKIGFDARELKPAKDRGQHPIPGKLRGFLICRDTLDQNGLLMVDLPAMAKYNVDSASIQKAKSGQLKAEAGYLPAELRFVLMYDAIQTSDGHWSYPGTFGEEYELWGKMGRMCHGDGEKAHRRQDDGTRREIECVPNGKDGARCEDFCPFSVKGECKAKSRLILCLLTQIDGKPKPLDDVLGWDARFRFDTSSENNPLRILGELDAAANKLNGNIAGIPGTLVFAVQRKRTGNVNAPVGIVGQVMFSLSEVAIRQREEEMWGRKLAEHQLSAAHPTLALNAHAPSSEITPDEEEPVTVMHIDDDEPEYETEPEAMEPEAPSDAPSEPEEMSDLRRSAIAAKDILMQAYPTAKDPIGFELYNRWDVTTVEDVPEEGLAELINVMREIYREQQDDAEGENQ